MYVRSAYEDTMNCLEASAESMYDFVQLLLTVEGNEHMHELFDRVNEDLNNIIEQMQNLDAHLDDEEEYVDEYRGDYHSNDDDDDDDDDYDDYDDYDD